MKLNIRQYHKPQFYAIFPALMPHYKDKKGKHNYIQETVYGKRYPLTS